MGASIPAGQRVVGNSTAARAMRCATGGDSTGWRIGCGSRGYGSWQPASAASLLLIGPEDAERELRSAEIEATVCVRVTEIQDVEVPRLLYLVHSRRRQVEDDRPNLEVMRLDRLTAPRE